MKAMILAAGRGERLRPLTDTTPKPLIYAGYKRLIEYTIESLVSAGITDIVINYAHLGEQFPEILGSGSQYQANITYSPELTGGLETAGGIVNALPLLDEEQFLVVNGDIWTDFDFSKLAQFQLDKETLCHLIMVTNPEHNTKGDFALDSSGNLSTTAEPKFTFSGIALYQRRMFEGLSSGKRALKPLFDKAIAEQAASGEVYEGKWSDIGTIERLETLKKELQNA